MAYNGNENRVAGMGIACISRLNFPRRVVELKSSTECLSVKLIFKSNLSRFAVLF